MKPHREVTGPPQVGDVRSSNGQPSRVSRPHPSSQQPTLRAAPHRSRRTTAWSSAQAVGGVASYVAGTTSAAYRLGPLLSRKLLVGLAAAALVVLAVAAYAYQFFTPQKASSAHGSNGRLSTPSS